MFPITPNILWTGILVTSIPLALLLVSKIFKIKQLQLDIASLQKSLDEMDEQAKLIVRTDMELNKIQEELDKKITGLYALQRLSRAISTTLEEIEIFKLIGQEFIEDIGFEKALLFLWDKKRSVFSISSQIGYGDADAFLILSGISNDRQVFLHLIQKGLTASSIGEALTAQEKKQIAELFKVNSFVISAVLPKEGDRGFFFVGISSRDSVITEGDEETVTILTNQIGTSLENARLFDKAWQTQQELEKKVEERTRQLTLALDEVRQASKRKSDFVSNVSHELRTPLTAVKGYASLLISGKLGPLPADALVRVGKMNQRCDELVGMINDLLDISRIESGRVTMLQESCDLTKIVAEISDLFAIMMRDKRIEFACDVPPGSLVFVDYNQIKRSFINLVSNAIKYTPAGGRISLKIRKIDGSRMQVDISDTGCGIPAEAQGKLFHEFYRVDTPINQDIKGTGLGLALVKNIIEAHKGKIWVKSEPGSGTVFSFTLPVME